MIYFCKVAGDPKHEQKNNIAPQPAVVRRNNTYLTIGIQSKINQYLHWERTLEWIDIVDLIKMFIILDKNL